MRLAWEARFREQEDVLKWPEELLPDFIAAVEPLKPIEATVKYPTPAEEELKIGIPEPVSRLHPERTAQTRGDHRFAMACGRCGFDSSGLSRQRIGRWHDAGLGQQAPERRQHEPECAAA